jgi:hypothetical protein
MPAAFVESTFRAKLATDWTATPVLKANGDNETPDANAWLELQFPIGNGSQAFQRRYFEDGAARFVLNIKTGTELADGLALADELAALFRTQKLANGLETFAPSGPIVDNSNDNGNWFELSVIVPYRYQFDG